MNRQREKVDKRLRSKYHMPLRVVAADTEYVEFRVNRNWIAPFHDAHVQLVDLMQTLYDMASISHRRMPPSEVEDLVTTALKDLENDQSSTSDSSRLTRPTNYLSAYRGRHFLVLTSSVPGLLIGSKLDWARKQTAKFRKVSQDLRAYTTREQLDMIGKQFRSALAKPDVTKRRAAVEQIKECIWIDTRSALGCPKHWLGMPVLPPTNSKSWFAGPDGRWTQSIERTRLAPRFRDWLEENPPPVIVPTDVSHEIGPLPEADIETYIASSSVRYWDDPWTVGVEPS
jgi:hypothetical protein